MHRASARRRRTAEPFLKDEIKERWFSVDNGALITVGVIAQVHSLGDIFDGLYCFMGIHCGCRCSSMLRSILLYVIAPHAFLCESMAAPRFTSLDGFRRR